MRVHEGLVGAPVAPRRGVEDRGVLRVNDEEAAEGGDLLHRRQQRGPVDVRVLVEPRIAEEAFEAEDSRFPHRPQLLDVPRYDAAPKSDVHGKLAARRPFLQLEVFERGGARARIQGHVDEGRESSRRGGPGGRLIPFPFRASRFVDVNVNVDQTRHESLVVGNEHFLVGFPRGVLFEDSNHFAVFDGNRRGPFAVGKHDALGAPNLPRCHWCFPF